jgi:tripartite-type tricarboxylate transporter receptor subunit TctC
MMRMRIVNLNLLLLGATLLATSQGFTQDNFYKGKTLRIIVGTSAGGGYDAYTRTIARHMGKYILGNPSIVVDNMPGADRQTE